MLKLKKLQLLGFKSFCDRTELRFHGDGMAAIVGPNGCGKSNISDAISWVLGEQSAKSMRGIRMEDVIFAGTRDRKPMGMAEVTLTLIDPEVYDGPVIGEPEIEIQGDLKEDDWDEAELRAQKAEDAERTIEEVRPGVVIKDGVAIQDDEEKTASGEAGSEEQTPGASADSAENSEQTAQPEQVVLRIRRRKFISQSRTGEIAVTRRLFRSGESEYLLNGKLCRLRDIQDIFMGTGLGPESYAIIEQGRIGQILSSKPNDRRLIIEEAAGITKFKTRKRLAELRLESAKQNLSRVNDIFDEVTRQMNSLKRQAAKAERYAKLREEMRARCRIVLASKFTLMDADSVRLDQEIATLTNELRRKSETASLLEGQHSEKTQEGYRLENEGKDLAARFSEIQLDSERSSSRQKSNEERCTELETRIAASTAELDRTREQHQALAAECESNRGFLESVAAELAAAKEEAHARQMDVAGVTGRMEDLERQQEARRRSVLDLMGGTSRLRSQVAQAEESIASLARESDRLTTESEGAAQEMEVLGGKRGQISLEFESFAERVKGLDERIAQLRQTLAEKRQKETEGKTMLDGFRAVHATALGKRNSLQAVITEHGYSTESVRRLFQSGALEGGLAPVGVLADFLEVDHQYERVIDDFLRDELNYIVVKSWDAAEEGMRVLKTDVDGRATFLVHPEDAQAKFSFAVDEASRTTPPEAVVPLTRCVHVLNGFGKSLEAILPKLRDGFITPDSEVARNLALENPEAFFLSPAGECFHNVTVTGGRQRSEGPLTLKRELRDVARQLEELERQIHAREIEVATLGREIAEAVAVLDRLNEERREAERSAMTSGHALKQLETELHRTGERRNQHQVQIARTQEQHAQKEEAAARMRDEVEELERKRQELEAELNAVQNSFAELRASRDAAAQKAGEAQSAVAALEERRRSASSALERIDGMFREVSTRIQDLETQIARSQAEQEQRRNENVALAERLQALQAEREDTAKRAAQCASNAVAVRGLLAELDQQLKSIRQELDALRDRRGEISATFARLRSDIEHLESTCLGELGVPATELRADDQVARLEGDALAQEDAAYHEMKAKLESMGPVNMMALEEYQETAQRHGFLESQRKDLLESIENTQNTIKEIDAISQERFTHAFHAINENFQVAFRKLFGGGQGFMRLTDETNTAESGIDIVASPPGKKLQNVLLLSGGEKAMTALALLVGIFQYQPSPFCVLDEVDAPLDEANVGRFAEMVKEMSVQTQFVLITHSKRTMSASPVLYGVTMQEPGVSKVVSVRFGEAPPVKASA